MFTKNTQSLDYDWVFCYDLFMKTPESGISIKESSPKTYKIEHIGNLDIVVNLDYSNSKDIDSILNDIKSYPFRFMSNSKSQFIILKDKTKRFYLKYKYGSGMAKYTKEALDFLREGKGSDFIDSSDFINDDKRSRYTMLGILNEIVLSKKVRELINSNAAQELAKKYNFEGINFSEPIIAINDKKSHRKYLVYRPILGHSVDEDNLVIEKFAKELKQLFLLNGLTPNDLQARQFMTSNESGKDYINLIDIEAYRETETKIPEGSSREVE